MWDVKLIVVAACVSSYPQLKKLLVELSLSNGCLSRVTNDIIEGEENFERNYNEDFKGCYRIDYGSIQILRAKGLDRVSHQAV